MPENRQDRVLDAAIEVLGGEGSRSLTHRAVDTAAGLPAGSTSNLFRTRQALIQGMVIRLETLDRAEWQAIAATVEPADPAGLAAALGQFVGMATGAAATRTAARYALFLESATRPELREPLLRSRDAILDWGSHWLELLGSRSPREHCLLVLRYLDGLILHLTAFPEHGFDPAPGIRELLAALVDPER